ncbi:LysR substrate-binding domain-containing protein [Brevibacterium daeguense]|uniref:LysR substrate-binding domain-containing protein n=1 Tax=Brevibacterium daeguense TaxID=909936 RepID=A0ABP8EHR1_9MICO|nr:LysR family transcriptional regulator [Brevibacterium daeguense]
MEIHQIRAFLAVAEELHFGRAAEKLGMAQPPLSRTIRQLERELGTDLFHRTTRSVTLSPAGKALIAPARAVLDSAETARESIKLATLGEIGHVRFGFAGASSNKLVARLAYTARQRKPGITLDLESTTFATEALSRVIDGTLDLALVRWQAKPPRITGRPVMIERPVVAMYSDHPFVGRPSLEISDIADEELVLLPGASGSAMRELIFHWFFRAGHTPKVVQEAPDSWMVGALVSAGMGISITYDSVIASFNDPNLVTVPLKVDHDPIKVYLAHREDDDNPALHEVLAAAEIALPTVSDAAVTAAAAG